MKKIILTMIALAMVFSIHSQKLIDIYKKGTVRLVPDTEYAKSNNWDQVFRSSDETKYGRAGARKSLVVMPDGSVVVNHSNTDYYTRFSPQGKFVKEFGIKSTKGKPFKKIMPIEGFINGNTFFTQLDNPGNMYFIDFNGKWLKTLKFKYSVSQMVLLPNNKLAVVGWAIEPNRFRDLVSIIDLTTNKENVLWEFSTDRGKDFAHTRLFSYSYEYKSGGSIGYHSMPVNNNLGMSNAPIIAYVKNELIVSIPSTGELMVYGLKGELKSKEKVSWGANYISVEEQKQIQKKAIEEIKKCTILKASNKNTDEESAEAKQIILQQMEEDLTMIKDPIRIPNISTIIKDSDGNLLFFDFADKKNENNFNVWVYEKGGRFICQSRFVCDDYTLNINPSRMVFRNGYLYSLQNKKNVSGISLRLLRFKLKAN